ncbi:MAG: hypothetical protein ACKVOM_00675 [Ferruginibacter sp.]
MSKSKKQMSEDDGPAEPGIPFLDAIKLAVKTPPTAAMDLLVDDEQELSDLVNQIPYQGRVVTFKQIHIEPRTENIYEFFVEVKSSLGMTITLFPVKLKGTNSYAAFLSPNMKNPEQFATLKVKNGEEIRLTLKKKRDEYDTTNVEFCRIYFTLGVNYPVQT